MRPVNFDGPINGGSHHMPSKDGDILDERWIQLGERPEFLLDPPPPQRWLLDRFSGGSNVGVLPRGRVGLLTGTGGVSKTYAAIQLGIAVASGGFWLDSFRAVEAGHVLLALGEEDEDETRRRLWRACNAAGLDTAARRALTNRLDILPLAGVSVALTASQAPSVVVATEIVQQFRRKLDGRGVDWALVVIDPLSRWAGGGVEGDNEAATRFVQVVESFTGAKGNPSIVVTHHSSKASAQNGASDSRGVSGIRDGFRWMASLDKLRSHNGVTGVRMRNGKSNYSLEFDDLLLIRNGEPGFEGTLRLATPVEIEQFGSTSTGKAVSREELARRVLETVRKRPGLTSPTRIAELTRGTKQKILGVVKDLRRNGLLELAAEGFVVPEPTGGVNQ